jgi:hypothetical protein
MRSIRLVISRGRSPPTHSVDPRRPASLATTVGRPVLADEGQGGREAPGREGDQAVAEEHPEKLVPAPEAEAVGKATTE